MRQYKTVVEQTCDLCREKFSDLISSFYEDVVSYSLSDVTKSIILFRASIPYSDNDTDVCLKCRIKIMEKAIKEYKEILEKDELSK